MSKKYLPERFKEGFPQVIHSFPEEAPFALAGKINNKHNLSPSYPQGASF
jgi:hypothetical protein